MNPRMQKKKDLWKITLTAIATAVLATVCSLPAHAVALSNDAQSAIPQHVQQLIDIDYRAMENSPTAMQMKARLLPPQLKQLEDALGQSGLNTNQDIDSLCFVAYRPNNNDSETRTLGIAQGQFSVSQIVANFKHKHIQALKIRNNSIYPMGASGMLVTFLNPTTMLFGSLDALRPALEARDGLAPSVQSDSQIMSAMQSVQSQPIWSVLDQKGTQFMMRSLLGQASQLANFDALKNRLLSSDYTMNFNNGVKFAMNVNTPDTITAATMSSLLNAAVLYEKLSGTPIEKQALEATNIDSSAGTLEVHFATTDDEFASLLSSPLFQSVVK